VRQAGPDPAPGLDRLGTVEVSEVDGVAEVDPVDWSRLARGRGLYAGRQWFAALEELHGFQARYLLARDGSGRLLCALPVYRIDQPANVSLYDHYGLFVQPVLGGAAQPRDWFPAFYVGGKAGYLNDVLIDCELDAAEGEKALRALTDRLQALASSAGVRCLVWFYLRRQPARCLLRALPAASALLSGAHMFLHVTWSSFDQYLAWLSPGRRWSARREMEQFRACAYEVRSGRLSECYEAAAPLLANVQQKYGHGSTPEEMRNLLGRQVATLDEQSVAFQLRRQDRLVAYSLCFEWESELFLRNVGFDYEATGGCSEYFNLAGYMPIAHAIERGLEGIHFGFGSYPAKMNRGARPMPLWSIVLPLPERPDWRAGLEGHNRDRLKELERQMGRPPDGGDSGQWQSP
jgi:uncharacterized protein